jgi:hypothetical protein
MPRYVPAGSGTRSESWISTTAQNGSSRHVLTIFDSRSRIISEFRSGLLIRGFGVHDLLVVAGGHPGHDPVPQRIENEARQ